MSQHETPKLDRLGTGVPKLDQVMDGGFPLQSVSILAGEPGAGKTVLALQMMFAAAAAGKKCLYFTTLSEPSLKLMRYMQLFEFFDQDVVDRQIRIHDLGSRLRAQDPESALSELAEQVEQHEPDLVVVDSFKAIHDLIPESHRARTFVYDLAVQLAAWGVTTLLVGEYTEDELARYPEFAIADGIVRLGVARQALARVRELEIRKLRGSAFVNGVHFFEIRASGIVFYPRVRGPEDGDPSFVSREPGRVVSSGIAELDRLLCGGYPEASATLIMGGTGTGKTLLGLHFVVDGARKGEPCVLFTLEETIDQLRAIADAFGFDLSGLEKQGLVHLSYAAPVELSTDRFLNEARDLTERFHAKRAVVDSLTGLALGAVTDRRYKELVYSLAKHFRSRGITLLTTMEINELLGAAQLSGHGVSFAADNVVQLRYMEREGKLDRAISVIKARGVNLSTELRPFRIGPHGMDIGKSDELLGLRAVLTGLPTTVTEPTR